jgi:hypothetical protein
MTDDNLATWRGKILTEMTREELIEAVLCLGRQNRELLSPQAIQARAMGEVALLRGSYGNAGQRQACRSAA